MSYPSAPGQPDSGQPGYSPDSPQPGYPAPPGPGLPSYSQPGNSPQAGYPPPGYTPQPYSTVAPRTSTTGPKVLTFMGIVSLILGVAAVVVGVVFMVQPIAAIVDGTGSGVISRIDSGETAMVDLDADKRYAVWIVSDADSGTYSGDPVVTSPEGREITVTSSTAQSGSSDGTSVTSGWTFTTDEAGTYEISAPLLSSGQLVLTSEDLIIRVGLGVVLLVVGIGIGVVGFGLTLGGAIWWHSRKKKARTLAGPSYA